MWRILTSLLYLANAHGHAVAPRGYGPLIFKDDYFDVPPYKDKLSFKPRSQSQQRYQKLEQPRFDLFQPGQWSPELHPYIDAIANLIEQYQRPPKPKYETSKYNPDGELSSYLDVEYQPSDVSGQITPIFGDWVPVPNQDSSVVQNFILVDNFGRRLLGHTQLINTMSPNDVARFRQYNALFFILAALARDIRHSCTDVDLVYEQVYQPTVDNYYNHALQAAGQVPRMIEDYMRRGLNRLQKVKRVIQETCKGDITSLYCIEAVEMNIRASPFVYLKELETLDALSKFARSYLAFDGEFHLAAERGMYNYLQTNKLRLKPLILLMVNSVDHLTDKPAKCYSPYRP